MSTQLDNEDQNKPDDKRINWKPYRRILKTLGSIDWINYLMIFIAVAIVVIVILALLGPSVGNVYLSLLIAL